MDELLQACAAAASAADGSWGSIPSQHQCCSLSTVPASPQTNIEIKHSNSLAWLKEYIILAD